RRDDGVARRLTPPRRRLATVSRELTGEPAFRRVDGEGPAVPGELQRPDLEPERLERLPGDGRQRCGQSFVVERTVARAPRRVDEDVLRALGDRVPIPE